MLECCVVHLLIILIVLCTRFGIVHANCSFLLRRQVNFSNLFCYLCEKK